MRCTPPGSFDLVEFEVTGGDNPDFKVTVNDRLADPWGMGVGFATQMVFIFIDTDGDAGQGPHQVAAGPERRVRRRTAPGRR